MRVIMYQGSPWAVVELPRLRQIRVATIPGLLPFWECSGAGLTFLRDSRDEAFEAWLRVHVYQLFRANQGLAIIDVEGHPS